MTWLPLSPCTDTVPPQRPEPRDDLTAEIEQNRLRLVQYREHSKEPQHAAQD